MVEYTIKNTFGEQLVGIQEGERDTIAILCHGSRGKKEEPILTAIAEAIKGICSTYRFDHAGNGASEGNIEESTYDKEQEDINSVIQHFKAQGKKRFILIGHSKGGSNTLKYADEHPETLIASICLAPRINIMQATEMRMTPEEKEALKEQGYYMHRGQKITQAYIDNIVRIDNLKDTLKESELPILLIHGTQDTTIPYTESSNYAKERANITAVLIEGADHQFSKEEDRKHIANSCRTWLSDIIK